MTKLNQRLETQSLEYTQTNAELSVTRAQLASVTSELAQVKEAKTQLVEEKTEGGTSAAPALPAAASEDDSAPRGGGTCNLIQTTGITE